MITNIFWITFITIVHLSKSNDVPKTAADSGKISSRDYPSASGSSYYTTFSGYPSYPSTSAGSADPFKPSDYGGYYNGVQDSKKKPPYPTYPSYPTTYYPPEVSLPDCQEQMMTNVIGDILQTGGVARFGLLRSIVATITAGILAKIPIILAIKALMIKLILVPLGFMVLSLPIVLPILLLFTPLWTRIKETVFGTTTAAPLTTPQTIFVMMQPNATNTTQGSGKSLNSGPDMFIAIMESDRCFERLACQLGFRDADSIFIRPVTWLLKFLQTFKFVQNNIEIRSTLKRYRDAYLQGVTLAKKMDGSNSTNTKHTDSDICTDDLYPCNIPLLYSRPEFSGYSRYLRMS